MLQHTLKRIFFSFSSYYPKHPDLSSTESTFYANKLRNSIKKPKLTPPPFDRSSLEFGKHHTDHMITVDFDRNSGWSDPVFRSFESLHLHPFNPALHYGVQCYQGTKAYKNEKGEIRLFRVEQNALRFKRSSVRLTLPDFDGQELINLIVRLVKEDEKWIPPISECSLYIRPFHLGISESLGVHSPEKSKLIITAGPVGSYYASGFKPISLYCATESIRSAPKGTGFYKIGGNYGPTIQTARSAASKGHNQVLWLYDDKVIQVGSSNIFFVFKDKSGAIEVATPELEDLVLPGITRDSILEMLRDQNQYKVSQRKIFINQVIQRQEKGELLECFGAGTAVIVSGVNNINYKGKDYPIGVDPKLNIGAVSYQIRQNLLDIQEGRKQDRYGWITRVK